MIRLAAVAVVALGLAACDQDRAGRVLVPGLPPIPADIVTCLESRVDVPEGALTKAKLAQLVLDQDRLIRTLRGCGKRAVEFYQTNRALLDRIAKEQARASR